MRNLARKLPRDDVTPAVVRAGLAVVASVSASVAGAAVGFVKFLAGKVRLGSELRRGIEAVELSVATEVDVVVAAGVDRVARDGYSRFFSPSSPTSAVSFRLRLKFTRNRLNL